MSSFARRVGKVMRNVDLSGDCWLWLGELRQGYGYHGGRPAHRVLYELLAGTIPEGHELDHLCKTPRCVCRTCNRAAASRYRHKQATR